MTLNSPPSLVPFSHALIYYPMQSTGQVFYFQNLPAITAEDFAYKSLDNEQILEILYLATWQLENLPIWSEENIYQTLKGLAAHFDIKLKDFMQPFFCGDCRLDLKHTCDEFHAHHRCRYDFGTLTARL